MCSDFSIGRNQGIKATKEYFISIPLYAAGCPYTKYIRTYSVGKCFDTTRMATGAPSDRHSRDGGENGCKICSLGKMAAESNI